MQPYRFYSKIDGTYENVALPVADICKWTVLQPGDYKRVSQ